MTASDRNRIGAQQAADRVRLLREDLASPEVASVLALTPEQQTRFDEWSRARLAALAEQFDVDTTASQKRVSWAMRITATIGALAICAAVVLFFLHIWGDLGTTAQLAIVVPTPLVLLAATEFVSHRERTPYFTGLLALVALASFILNLEVVGMIFNITPTEGPLLAWGAFAVLLAYRYGLRLMLALGLLSLMSYLAAAYLARMGYSWLNSYDRPERTLLLGLLIFALALPSRFFANVYFQPVYELVGSITVLLAMLSLSEWGEPSYLNWQTVNIERFYGIAGLFVSAAAIWFGIVRYRKTPVNTGSVFFVLFLFARLYHWWWDWMPRYLFFALIGALGIALVLAFRRLRDTLAQREETA